MITVKQIGEALERIAPAGLALSKFDNVGLMVGDMAAAVTGVLTSLDLSLATIQAARDHGCSVIVVHHPLLFEPIRTVDADDYSGRRIHELIRAGIACFAAHTNWDAAQGGVNDCLAEAVGLQEVRPFGMGEPQTKFKLVTFVPETSLNAVIDALSAAGAGQIGAYERCAFSSAGTGTFRAGPTANPTIGTPGQQSDIDEIRLEMLVPVAAAKAVERALRRTHPYETPAVDWVPLRAEVDLPLGRVGDLSTPLLLSDYLPRLAPLFPTIRTWGPNKPIHRVAVCGGASDGDWRAAHRAGADLFITGEVRHHNALEASDAGLCLAECGHYATEQPAMIQLSERLRQEVPEVFHQAFVPAPGSSGRPMDP